MDKIYETLYETTHWTSGNKWESFLRDWQKQGKLYDFPSLREFPGCSSEKENPGRSWVEGINLGVWGDQGDQSRQGRVQRGERSEWGLGDKQRDPASLYWLLINAYVWGNYSRLRKNHPKGLEEYTPRAKSFGLALVHNNRVKIFITSQGFG